MPAIIWQVFQAMFSLHIQQQQQQQSLCHSISSQLLANKSKSPARTHSIAHQTTIWLDSSFRNNPSRWEPGLLLVDGHAAVYCSDYSSITRRWGFVFVGQRRSLAITDWLGYDNVLSQQQVLQSVQHCHHQQCIASDILQPPSSLNRQHASSSQ